MRFTTALFTALSATAAIAAPMGPIVPPQNPSSNGQQSYCTSRTECLQIINQVRASQEGLSPISLPNNWSSLSASQRVFAFINLERASRGIPQLKTLVTNYDSEVQTAITNDADPVPPSSINSGWSSIWAGGDGMIPLSAMYLWMYYDGPGGSNEDCTSTDQSGCWGHRDAILDPNMNAADVGAGNDSHGQKGYAAIFFDQ